MAGLSARTGQMIEGWAHVQQSIGTILATAIGGRVMRRDFGSDLSNLVGAPMNNPNIMALFACTAAALEARLVDGNWYGEPRFQLSEIRIVSVGETGKIGMVCIGTYYPDGAEGDYSKAQAVVTDAIMGIL